MRSIEIYYRGWKMQADDRTASAAKVNGSEQFNLTDEQPCFEEALRAVKQEVNEREGEQEWDMNYTNEALR